MPTSMTQTTNLANDMYKKDGDTKTRANNFYHKRETNDTKSTKSSSGRNRDRESHHRHSYDLSSSNPKTSFHTTANGHNRSTIASKQSTTTKSNSNKNRPLSPSSAPHKESKYLDYESLLKQFEKLKLKADFFADKDPEFAAKLINLANKITKSAPKMDSSFYPNAFYSRSPAYSTHSNYPSSNIYSTFNSSNFSQFGHPHYPSQHHHTPPTNPPPPPPPRPPPIPPHVHRNSSNAKYPSEPSTSYFPNTNFSSFSYDNAQYPSSSHFNRQSSANAPQASTFDHNVYTQFFNYSYPNVDNSFKYSYSFAHERPEDLLLILEDPYDSNKLTVSLTNVNFCFIPEKMKFKK
ncbi:hypothetical protein BpHYR1_036302 [Brachionus plicatilis]|uniref:Uncharacterized protein n=1 Tax=Brachionus plicatilis TaxID=10195 RepID=A0A3M7SLG8_BRAPC|nr:hypothetical protein BpHYR1_036302 [Brachionus plicatilis]